MRKKKLAYNLKQGEEEKSAYLTNSVIQRLGMLSPKGLISSAEGGGKPLVAVSNEKKAKGATRKSSLTTQRKKILAA